MALIGNLTASMVDYPAVVKARPDVLEAKRRKKTEARGLSLRPRSPGATAMPIGRPMAANLRAIDQMGQWLKDTSF